MSRVVRGVNDFETWCRQNDRLDLLLEWDYEKNEGLKPSVIAYGTARKVWWKGKCGHSFQSSPNKRTSDKTSCPYCCESHARLLQGFNDLATTNPELLDSWDYEKNGSLLPNMVMAGQHKKVWWKGECGHSWQAALYHRTKGRGCPICKKESRTSFQEQAIFFYLKKVFPDVENSNKSVLGIKELDIYIPSINTAIEFDGKKWHDNIQKDVNKNILCKSKGIKLYRVRDIECPSLPVNDGVTIIRFESYTSEGLTKALDDLFKALGVNVEVNIERDRISIINQYVSTKKKGSLAATYPELAQEWHPTKNGNLTPEMVSRMSDKSVWWLGKCGHEWQTMIHARTKEKSGCPICSKRRMIKGINDFATLHHDLLCFWDYKKNIVQPEDLSAKSNQKVWWICPQCHSSYEQTVSNRVNNHNGCLFCTGRQLISSDDDTINNADMCNDLATTNPELLKYWDYEKNGDLLPTMVRKWQKLSVWWKGDCGHSWQAAISNRVNGRGCPFCSGRRVLKGFNDLASVHPETAKRWHPTKNGKDTPDEVTSHSIKEVWWIGECGHEWKRSIDKQIRTDKCPICTQYRKKVLNLDTGEVFSSLEAAAKSCGLVAGDTISFCCKGKQEMAGGFHWKFVD